MSMSSTIPGGSQQEMCLGVVPPSGLSGIPIRSILGRVWDIVFGTKLGRMAVAGGALAAVGKKQDIVRNAIVGAVVVEGIHEGVQIVRGVK